MNSTYLQQNMFTARFWLKIKLVLNLCFPVKHKRETESKFLFFSCTHSPVVIPLKFQFIIQVVLYYLTSLARNSFSINATGEVITRTMFLCYRLQLMCYKYMWDTTISHNFPASRFYSFFGLNSHYILSEEVQGLAATSGISAKVYSASLQVYICVSLLFAPDCTYEMRQLESGC